MASEAKVDALFELPVFVQMIPQFVQPMINAYAEVVTGSEEDAADLMAVTEGVNDHVMKGMLDLVKKFYVEIMTDEEVDLLSDIYSNPAFLRLMQLTPQIAERMVGWFNENEDELQRLFDEGVAAKHRNNTPA